jgi:hypothetical protein
MSDISFAVTIIDVHQRLQMVSDDSVLWGFILTFPALVAGSYYTGSGATGTSYAPGDDVVINTTQTFMFMFQKNFFQHCSDETTFVTAVDSPVVTLSGGCC